MLSELHGAAKVADIGCGEGYILSRITAAEVVGVDISVAAVRQAVTIAPDATIVRAAAESLPFVEGYFDAAICSEVIEHTVEPGRVLAELSRIVRHGGRVVLSIPNEPLINRIKDIVWAFGLSGILLPDVPRRQNEEWHLHSFNLPMLRRICPKTLAIVKVHALPFPFLPIRYVVVCENKAGPSKAPSRLFPHQTRKKAGYVDALGRKNEK